MKNETREEWQGPRRQAPSWNVGRRWTHKDAERYGNGVVASTRNKTMRRVLRGALRTMESRISRRIADARHELRQVQRLATNSHEAKRYVAARQKERRQDREFKSWLNAWCFAWHGIGNNVAALTQFVRDGGR